MTFEFCDRRLTLVGSVTSSAIIRTLSSLDWPIGAAWKRSLNHDNSRKPANNRPHTVWRTRARAAIGSSDPRGLGLLIVGTVIGMALAAAVFAISAIAVPLLMVERVDVVRAALTSVGACRENSMAMALWAALIVGAMLCGFVTLFFGLVIMFPLIGHATWHAFRT